MKFVAAFIATIVASSTSFGQGPAKAVQYQREAGVLFLHAADVATELSLKLEIVQPGKLVTYCQSGANGLCIPVRLTPANHRGEGRGLYLASTLVSSSLRAAIVVEGDIVSLKSTGEADGAAYEETPGYNSDWRPGRGFSKGETLPDIPLMDMQGGEVRFSKYLGKRYILYCWASW